MAGQKSSRIFQLNGAWPQAYLTRLLPLELARRYEVVPLGLRDNRLLIASGWPLTQADKIELQRIIHHPLDVFPASIVDVRAARRELYQDESENAKALSMEQILLLTGLLTETQLAAAREFHHVDGKDLAAIALEQHWITTEEYSEAVGLALGLPHFRPRTASPLGGINSFIAYDQSEILGALPLWWIGNVLYLAVSEKQALDGKDKLRALAYNHRMVVCDPATYAQVRKTIYKPKLAQRSAMDERKVADWLVQDRSLAEDELMLALEIQARTDIALKEILRDQFNISARDWLDASAEVFETVSLHAEDLPKDIHERVRLLWELLPENILLQFNLLPLNLENGTLVLGMPDLDSDLMDLSEAYSGYRVESRLMDADLIHELQESVQSTPLGKDEKKKPWVNALDMGDFLVRATLIQRDQLNELLEEEGERGAELGELLIQANLLNEIDLAEIYSLMSGVPYLTLEYFRLDSDLAGLLPAELALDRRLLPLFENEGDLWVGVADLHSCDVLGEVETLSGRRVWPVLVPKSSLLSALNRFYHFGQNLPDANVIFQLTDRLVREGMLTQANALEVATAVVEQNVPFDQAVLNLGKAKADDLYRILAQIYEVEFVSLGLVETREESFDSLGELRVYSHWSEPLDVNTARLIDMQTARRLTAIPVSQNNAGVRVAFADLFYEAALEELAFLLNRKIIPCLASRVEINDAIQRILGQMNLGTSLLMAGKITISQLNNALTLAQNSNIRLGRALVQRGFIHEKELYQFLSHQAKLPLFDLTAVELSPTVARMLDAETERRQGILPLAVDEENVYLAMVDPLNEDGIRLVEERVDKKAYPVLVTENDFDLAMEKLYSEEYLDKSTSELLRRSPQDSAFYVLSRAQIYVLLLLLVTSVAWLAWNYLSFLIVVNSLVSIFYLLFSGYKAWLITKALSSNLEVDVTDEDVAALKDRDLPIYTILVPVYNEAKVLPKILERLSELDYPTPKLDIKILMEANDRETIDAFFLANPSGFIHAVIVPDAQPKTKPKACNYGLIHARGEYLVIYDAEDLPEPDQLKRVVAAYGKVPADVVCIQAKLNYYNRTQNVLTQWFTSEYSMWFNLLLPGLDDAHAPIPLGGTSNHFKTFSLIEVGAWDPYNVTEDADLGIRLYKRGYRTRIVDSTTYEEANSQLSNWIRQRSRWVKGYIQTWLVHMRHPVKLLRELGPRAFLSFQLLIGGTFLSLLLNPVYWLMTSAWYFFRWDLVQSLFPGPIFYIGALCLYIGNFVFTYANVAGAMRCKYYDMVRVTLFSPAYWGLMSVGAWKGFIQLLTKPHFWEKTIHGLHMKSEGEESA